MDWAAGLSSVPAMPTSGATGRSDRHRRRTEDGRWLWSSDLEAPLLATALETDPGRPIPTTDDLPDMPIACLCRPSGPSPGTTYSLRRQTGDATVMPFARYVRAETGAEPSDRWRSGTIRIRTPGRHSTSAWEASRSHWSGRGPDGELLHAASDPNATRKVVVRTVADHLGRWLREVDPSMEGPGVGSGRRSLCTRTRPCSTSPVDRAGAARWIRGASACLRDSSRLGSAPCQAKEIGVPAIARLANIPRRTVSEVVSGRAEPSRPLAGIPDAVAWADRRRCSECQQSSRDVRTSGGARPVPEEGCQTSGDQTGDSRRSGHPMALVCRSRLTERGCNVTRIGSSETTAVGRCDGAHTTPFLPPWRRASHGRGGSCLA